MNIGEFRRLTKDVPDDVELIRDDDHDLAIEATSRLFFGKSIPVINFIEHDPDYATDSRDLYVHPEKGSWFDEPVAPKSSEAMQAEPIAAATYKANGKTWQVVRDHNLKPQSDAVVTSTLSGEQFAAAGKAAGDDIGDKSRDLAMARSPHWDIAGHTGVTLEVKEPGNPNSQAAWHTGEAFSDEKTLNLDVVIGPSKAERARAIHRVVRAMHDGHCPSCSNLSAAHRFIREDRHECPSCGFSIFSREAKAALKEFKPYLEESLRIFEEWRFGL